MSDWAKEYVEEAERIWEAEMAKNKTKWLKELNAMSKLLKRKGFRREDMTGKTRGIWFVICCERCKREEQAIGQVVWEPEIERKSR